MDSGIGSRKGQFKTMTVTNLLYIHDAPIRKAGIAFCHRLWQPVYWPLPARSRVIGVITEGAVISDLDRRASF